MIDLDELMKLREAATPGPWEHKIDDAFDDPSIHDITPYVASCVKPDNAAYIVAACNAVPELVARIRELERLCEQQQHRLDFKSAIIAGKEDRHA